MKDFNNVSKYGGDHFVTEGFSDWKNSQRLANHATSSNSHVDCVHMSYALMNPNQSIKAAFEYDMDYFNAITPGTRTLVRGIFSTPYYPEKARTSRVLEPITIFRLT
ncbi:hypothetical protein JHK86_050428 [Glycine max]|nr:hypothetical protein JHK86_050428 [Glycine max]